MEIDVRYNEEKGRWQTTTGNNGKRTSIREYETKEDLISYFKDWGLSEKDIKSLISV